MITRIKNNIDKRLKDILIKKENKYKIKDICPNLYYAIYDFCTRKGKRIRPILFIITYKGYLPRRQRLHPSIYNAACSIELLHAFMLVHDDIIDNSKLRRGSPTMHILLKNIAKTKRGIDLGKNLAIIAGDIIYAMSVDAFLSIKEDNTRKQKALQYFTQTAALTAVGEFIDTVTSEFSLDKIKEKDILLNYTLKTARYTFISPMVTAAILAGATQEEIKKLNNVGLAIGQAFQIQDDIIGVFGSSKDIGKSVISDIEERKKTLLVFNAYTQLNKEGKKLFSRYFNKPHKTSKEIALIKNIFIETGSLKLCLQEIEKKTTKALKEIDKLKIEKRFIKEISNIILKTFQYSSYIAKRHKINFKIAN